MKLLLLFLTLLAWIANPASAGPNALGSMVLHTDDAVSFSAGQDYCALAPLPATCLDLVTQIDKSPDVEAIVWIVASFPDGTSPRVSAFQVGVYGDIPFEYYSAWAPCGPGVLEIPDATWPAPGTGTACTFLSTVTSNLFKMYWFAAAAPGTGSSLSTGNYPNGDRHAEWVDDGSPPIVDYCQEFGTVRWGEPGQNDCIYIPPPYGTCCFPDCGCQLLLATDCDAAGGMFIGGATCVPDPCVCIGACCLAGGGCADLDETNCLNQGGTWEGSGTDCATFTCPPPPTGACCFPDCTCENLTQQNCDSLGGEWMGLDVRCEQNPCGCAKGACCLSDGSCRMTDLAQCDSLHGDFQSYGILCSPNPCHPTPTKVTTWGEIKAAYR